MKIKAGDMEFPVKRLVVKLGTKQLTDLKQVNYKNITKIVNEIVELRKQGFEFVLTISGAIGMGMMELPGHLSPESLTIPEKQAIAGIGQVRLMEIFHAEFAKHDIQVGQVLLTHYIFENRKTYLNARNTLSTMLNMGIIPIINENDSVAVDEIKVGDNDRLGAQVALLIDADIYIMLTDIDGFYKNYDSDKRELVKVINMDEDKEMEGHAGDGAHHFTTGGMVTKLKAARITTLSCIPSVIANGFKDGIIGDVLNNLREGTIFVSNRCRLNYRKRWISGKKPQGQIVVDQGAAEAVRKHNSLLASGIIRCEGEFSEGDIVLVIDESGNHIARGMTQYAADEVTLIAGKQSGELESILGYKNTDYVAHVDNMVIL